MDFSPLFLLAAKHGDAFQKRQKENPCYLHFEKEQDVFDFVNNIMQSTSSSLFLDVFPKEAEEKLLQTCCFFLIKECIEDDHTLLGLKQLLHTAVKRCCDGEEKKLTVLDFLLDELTQQQPEHAVSQAYAAFHAAVDNFALSDFSLKVFYPASLKILIAFDCIFRLYSYSLPGHAYEA